MKLYLLIFIVLIVFTAISCDEKSEEMINTIPEPDEEVLQDTIPSIKLIWEKTLGGSESDTGNDIIKTSDGNLMILGQTSSNDGDVSNNIGDQNLWAVKIDTAGNIIWQNVLGSPTLGETGFSTVETSDGGFIFMGYQNDGTPTGSESYNDYFVVKTDPSGNVLWEKRFGGDAGDYGRSVTATEDGGCVIFGYWTSIRDEIFGFNAYSVIIKLDKNGNLEWEKALGGSSHDYGYHIEQTNDKGYVLGITSSSDDYDLSENNGGLDAWVVKLSPLGEIEWEKVYGSSSDEQLHSIKETLDGGYILAGYSFRNLDGSENNGKNDFWLVKININGDVEWQTSLGGSESEFAYDVIEASDGGFVATGYSDSSDKDVSKNNGSADCWLIKVNKDGEILWQHPFGGSETDLSQAVVESKPGEYMVIGTTTSPDGDIKSFKGLSDVWLVKLAE